MLSEAQAPGSAKLGETGNVCDAKLEARNRKESFIRETTDLLYQN